MDDARDEGRGPSLRVVRGGASDAAGTRHANGGPGRATGEAVDVDTALVGAFLLGNDAAFGQLVARHEDLVLRIVRRYAASPEDARDLAQRTFLRAFEAARRAFGRPSAGFPFRRWVIRIAVNLAKNHLRDESRWTRAPAAVLHDTAADGLAPEVALLHAERAARLRREVLKLPRRQREVLTLRLDAELGFAEIADALGTTENACKVTFHHATRRLRAALEEDGR